ncbi:hypothetical protein CMT48_07675 [Elizabethkingia anophelis]|nr:hypothetical protein [Elizabethkingia anophelis]
MIPRSNKASLMQLLDDLALLYDVAKDIDELLMSTIVILKINELQNVLEEFLTLTADKQTTPPNC